MFERVKEWQRKRIAAAFENAAAITPLLDEIKERHSDFDYSTSSRGATVSFTTNIPADALNREFVTVLATPSRLIAQGDVVPFATVPNLNDCLLAKPSEAEAIAGFVKKYIRQNGIKI